MPSSMNSILQPLIILRKKISGSVKIKCMENSTILRKKIKINV